MVLTLLPLAGVGIGEFDVMRHGGHAQGGHFSHLAIVPSQNVAVVCSSNDKAALQAIAHKAIELTLRSSPPPPPPLN